MAFTGGCLCGSVRFEIKAEAPIAVRHCWCRICQYVGAGAGTVNATFPSEALAVSGSLAEYVSAADSGATMRRSFCGQCGTPLFSEAEQRPHLVVVRAGALDDPDLIRPAAIIWARSAPEWACFDSDLPRFEGQAPSPTV
jgi:hypothetical protein